MMSGAEEDSGEDSPDAMGDLLGSLLGGAGSQPGGGQAGGGDMMDLLGGLMGGQAAGGQQAGGMAGLLGGLLGGGSAPGGMLGGLLDPIADILSEKTGLPRETARAVVAFAISKLLPALLGDRASAEQDARSQDLWAHMEGEQGIDTNYLRSSGMADELAEQTGLDPETAEQSLEEVFSLLGQQMGDVQAPTPSDEGPVRPQLDGLDGLLDNWEPSQ
jgi:hypothetical protein